MKRRSKTYRVPHRRRRENKTDYRKRLRLLKSNKPRLIVRKSSNSIICQIIQYNTKGDIVIIQAHSRELKGFGWKAHGGNVSSAYLVGYLCGLKTKNKKIKEAVLDTGLYRSTKGSRIYAALKGVLDAGLQIPHSEEILPNEGRVSGKHIEDYAQKLLKGNKEKYNIIFSIYLKNKLKPEEMIKHFDNIKAKIKV